MVTPYPPVRDGIATYAAQAAAALRRDGQDVEVLSPGPSAAQHHLELVGVRGALALAKRVGRYDKVIVQYHPDFFYPVPSTPRERLAVSLALAAAFRLAKEVEVVVHEIDYRHGRLRGYDGWAARALWHSVDRIVVHTEGERQDFARAFGVSPRRIVLAAHGAVFVPHTFHDKASARASLGIPPDVYVFLAIGFVQEHKGFDRAITAFAGLGARGARYDIVGTTRVEEGNAGYANHVDVMATATDGVHRHKGYVSDELFDRWIVAADCVVLPYRNVWSSGVLERAALFHQPVIASRVGGLAEQAHGRFDITFVEDDGELREAMWARVVGRAGAPKPQPWPHGGPDLRVAVQRQISRRAAGARGSRIVTTGAGAQLPDDAVLAAGAISAPVRRVAQLQLPTTTSTRSSATFVKGVVRRLTAWQLEPVVGEVNALRAATVEALEQVAALRARDHQPAVGPDGAGGDRHGC